jgi:hypothetical protein
MRKTVLNCKAGVARPVRSIHGLKKEMPEFKRGISFWLGTALRINQLQLVAARQS